MEWQGAEWGACGVVAYPVMQAYGRLALEDNSEVGEAELGRCIISKHDETESR